MSPADPTATRPQTIHTTSLPGLLRITRPVLGDERGFFHEVVRLDELEVETGIPFVARQVNHSRSQAQTLRGLHAERWNKVVWLGRGRAFSAIVDIRPESPTFGRHETFELVAEEGTVLYIPEGCANSICALTDIDYIYLVTKVFDGSDTRAVAWDDPDLNIQWPVSDPILSQRDRTNPRLRDLFPGRLPS